MLYILNTGKPFPSSVYYIGALKLINYYLLYYCTTDEEGKKNVKK